LHRTNEEPSALKDTELDDCDNNAMNHSAQQQVNFSRISAKAKTKTAAIEQQQKYYNSGN
jgi:hypothetical protein